MTALYHLEQTELAQVWRGGTALRSSPVTLERSGSVFTGLKTEAGQPLYQRSSTWGRERSDPGTQVVMRWHDRAMGWAAKPGPDPSFWRCSVVTKRGNERSESGSPFVGMLRFRQMTECNEGIGEKYGQRSWPCWLSCYA